MLSIRRILSRVDLYVEMINGVIVMGLVSLFQLRAVGSGM